MVNSEYPVIKPEHEVRLEHISQQNSADPKAPRSERQTIDTETEKRLRRAFDYQVLPFGVLIYILAFIDRTNMGNARVLGMEEDADLQGIRFNLTLTGFYISYIVFEIPANMACRKFGPRIWLSFLTAGFGITTFTLSFVSSYPVTMALRVLLGCFESGIQPGIMYSYAQFYRRHELVSRWGIKASMASVAGCFGGLLASGLSQIPEAGILNSWRWIFFIEGLITVCFAALVFLYLPGSVSEARFLSESDRRYAAERITSETMTKEDPLDLLSFKRALLNWNTQLLAFATTCSLMTMSALSFFMPTLLRSMGYSGTNSQLLTVPPYTVSALCCLGVSFLSDRIKSRGLMFSFLTPFVVIGFALLGAVQSTGVRYFAVFLATSGAFTASPILLAWSVDNASGPAVRAIVAAYVVGTGNVGALIATWTYLKQDAPFYVRGHFINLGGGILMGTLVAIATIRLWRENVKRAKGGRDYRLELAPEQIDRLGHLHPAYKYTA